MGYRTGCGRCVIPAHSFHVRYIGLGHPFLGGFSYFVLLLPFCYFFLASGRELLHLDIDFIDRQLFPFFFMWALGRVVARFLAIETMDT